MDPKQFNRLELMLNIHEPGKEREEFWDSLTQEQRNMFYQAYCSRKGLLRELPCYYRFELEFLSHHQYGTAPKSKDREREIQGIYIKVKHILQLALANKIWTVRWLNPKTKMSKAFDDHLNMQHLLLLIRARMVDVEEFDKLILEVLNDPSTPKQPNYSKFRDEVTKIGYDGWEFPEEVIELSDEEEEEDSAMEIVEEVPLEQKIIELIEILDD